MPPRRPFRAALVIAALAVAAAACGGGAGPEDTVPADPVRGAAVFAATCAECHGPAAVGTDQGPPLVDSIYRPSHHADGAFRVAVLRGVPQHHWRFGSMPAQQGLTTQDVSDVTAYVRQLQIAAGID